MCRLDETTYNRDEALLFETYSEVGSFDYFRIEYDVTTLLYLDFLKIEICASVRYVSDRRSSGE